MRRLVLVAALGLAAAVPATAHAGGADACEQPRPDTRICFDTGRPGCVWGWVGPYGFITGPC